MSEIVHTQWSCPECLGGGTVKVTTYETGSNLTRTIPRTASGGLDPHIPIKCPRCSGVGCVVGYETKDWGISKEWLEARLAEYGPVGDEDGPMEGDDGS